MSNQSFFTDKTYARGDEAYVSAELALTAAEQAAADAQSALEAVAGFDPDGQTTTFFQADAPTSGMTNGDMWIDSNNGNHLWRYVDKYGLVAHTNLCQNPNGQYGVQTWTATNGTIASDSTVLYDTRYSLRSVVNSLAALPTMQVSVVASASGTYSASAYMRSSTASAITKYKGTISFRNGANTEIGGANIAEVTATAADQWVRLSFAGAVAPAGTLSAVLQFGPSDATEVQVSDAYFLNGVMWETGSTINPAISGDLDGCLWNGTPGASSSSYNPGWIDVQDQSIGTAILNAAGAQATADGKIRTFAQTSAPAMTNGQNIGDLWMDTDDSNKMYRWSGTSWVLLVDPRIASTITDVANLQSGLTTANGKIDSKAVIWYQSTAPTGLTAADQGDIWIDTSTSARISKVWSGSAWVDITDQATLDTLAVVNTKITTFYTTSPPTATAEGDLWTDTDDGNKLYRWVAPYGMLTRTNYARNPQPTTVTNWSGLSGNSVVTAPWNGSRLAYQTTGNGAGTAFIFAAPSPVAMTTGDVVTVSAMIDLPVGTYYRFMVHVRTGNKYYNAAKPIATATGSPVRVSDTATLTANDADVDAALLIYSTNVGGVLTNGTTARMGDVLIEKASTALPYFDGSSSTTTAWSGTANNSQSVYTPAWVDLTDTRLPSSIKTVVTEYSVNSSETVAPTTGWSTSTPARTPGTFTWYRTTITRTDNSTTTTNPALLTGNTGATGAPGTPAPLISLTSTTQVLAVPTGGGATTPATATVTGTALNTTIANWTYSVDGAAFSATVPTGVSRTGSVVTITGGTMTARTIAVKADDGTVGDTLTVAKVSDGAAGATGGTGGTGAAGADAYTVLLTNEAQVFAGSTSAALAGTATTSVAAYKGTVAQTATIGTITGQVTGLTTAITNNGTTAPLVTVTVTTALVTQSGTLTIPVTVAGISFTKLFSWSVSYTGATGSTGSTGSTGATGVSVTSITPYFQTLSTGSAAPAQPSANPPGGAWTTTEPTYTAGTELWRTELVIFSNATFQYTTVTKVSSYAAAVAAMTTASGKNKVYYSTSVPGTTANASGDIWYQYSTTGVLIGFWIGQGGTSWQIQQITNTVIANLDAAKITSGFMDVGRLQAQSIDVSKLALGVLRTNPINNSGFEDAFTMTNFTDPAQGDVYNWRKAVSTNATAIRALGAAHSGVATGALTILPTTGTTGDTADFYTASILLKAGSSYTVSFAAIATGAGATAGGKLYVDALFGPSATAINTSNAVNQLLSTEVIQGTPDVTNTFFTVPYSLYAGINADAYGDYSAQLVIPGGQTDLWCVLRFRTTGMAADSTIYIDDVAAIEQGTGGATEITSAGLRLFDSTGLESVALVNNRPSYFTVQNGAGDVVAGIDSSGAFSGANASFSGSDVPNDLGDTPNALTVGGEDYADRVGRTAQGVVQQVYQSASVSVQKIRTEYGIYEVSFTQIPGRLYRVTHSGGYVDTNNTAGTLSALARWRYTADGTSPTITSLLARTSRTIITQPSYAVSIPNLVVQGNFIGSATVPTLVRLLFTLNASNAGATEYINFTNQSGGGLATAIECIVEDLGPDVPNTWLPNAGGGTLFTGGTDTGGGGSPVTQKKTYTVTWYANSSQTRRGASSFGNNTVNTSAPSGYNLAGYYSSSNGNQYTYLGFTAGSGSTFSGQTISTAISGATVTKVELYVKNSTFFASSGGSQRFGMTTMSSMPSSGAASSTIAASYTSNISFTTGAAKWITLSAGSLSTLVGGGRVAVIGPGPSNSTSYYSKWYDHIGSYAPMLRITYTK